MAPVLGGGGESEGPHGVSDANGSSLDDFQKDSAGPLLCPGGIQCGIVCALAEAIDELAAGIVGLVTDTESHLADLEVAPCGECVDGEV